MFVWRAMVMKRAENILNGVDDMHGMLIASIGDEFMNGFWNSVVVLVLS